MQGRRNTADRSFETDEQRAAMREQLVEKAIDGDKEALINLCESISKNVYFRAHCKLQDHIDAEDATQEILIRVCTGITDLKNPRAFGKWLNTIIINETNRYFKKRSRHSNVLNIDDYREVLTEENEEFLPQEYIFRKEARSAVMEIINRLPERQMESIMLYYYEGLSAKEAAEVMGVTPQRVSECLSLARETIKNELDKQAVESSMARSVAALPIGVVLSNVLQQQAEFTATMNHTSIQETLNKAAEILNVSAPTLVGAAAAKTISAALVGAIATVVVGAAVVTGLWFGGVFETPEPSLEQPPVPDPIIVSDAVGTIVFHSETSEFSHVNPIRAEAFTNSNYGELEICSWMIVASGTGAVLFEGSGGIVENVFSEMLNDQRDGEYQLIFLLKDVSGQAYLLEGLFQIRNDYD